MMSMLRVLLAGVVLGWAGASAQAGEVDQWIAQLGSKSFVKRQEAAKNLKKMGDEALPALKKAAKTSKNPEVVSLVKTLIDDIDHSDWSKPVNGLRIQMTADTKKVEFGSTVNITISLWNVTSSDIELDCGLTCSGHSISSGNFLTLFDAKNQPIRTQGAIGFCGTGARNIIDVIPANQKKSFVVKAKYDNQEFYEYNRKTRKSTKTLKPMFSFGHHKYPVTPGDVTVKLTYKDDGKVHMMQPLGRPMPLPVPMPAPKKENAKKVAPAKGVPAKAGLKNAKLQIRPLIAPAPGGLGGKPKVKSVWGGELIANDLVLTFVK